MRKSVHVCPVRSFSDVKCGDSRYVWQLLATFGFDSCISSDLIAVFWQQYLTGNLCFLPILLCLDWAFFHKQKQIWHCAVVLVGADCAFKSLESSARFSQMRFVPGKFRWLMRFRRPNPKLKIMGIQMKCSPTIHIKNNSPDSELSLGCQPPAPSLWGGGDDEQPVLTTSLLALKALLLAAND